MGIFTKFVSSLTKKKEEMGPVVKKETTAKKKTTKKKTTKKKSTKKNKEGK
jgi:hypothetical protein